MTTANFSIPCRQGNTRFITRMVYNSLDPHAVRMTFVGIAGEGEENAWTIDRSLLRDCTMRATTGEHDVRFFQRSHAEIGMTLADPNNGGTWTVYLDRACLKTFVARIYEICPEGQEPVEAALDEFLNDLLSP